jgi:pterin-4a-carbinolamine dehydratase
MSKFWSERKKPARLERRIEFDDYEQTREFLERAADLAEREGHYPDMSFGRTYVSITLYPHDEAEAVNPELVRYADEVDELARAARLTC